MALMTARTLAPLQIASVRCAVQQALITCKLTLLLFSLHPSGGQESWDYILHGRLENRVIL